MTNHYNFKNPTPDTGYIKVLDALNVATSVKNSEGKQIGLSKKNVENYINAKTNAVLWGDLRKAGYVDFDKCLVGNKEQKGWKITSEGQKYLRESGIKAVWN